MAFNNTFLLENRTATDADFDFVNRAGVNQTSLANENTNGEICFEQNGTVSNKITASPEVLSAGESVRVDFLASMDALAGSELIVEYSTDANPTNNANGDWTVFGNVPATDGNNDWVQQSFTSPVIGATSNLRIRIRWNTTNNFANDMGVSTLQIQSIGTSNFSITADTVTKTGTTTDFSELEALLPSEDVWRIGPDNNGDGRTIFNIGNRKLLVEAGAVLDIDPDLYAIYTEPNAPRSVFDIRGTVNINGETIDNGVPRYSEEIVFWSSYQNGNCCTNFGLQVTTSGTLNWIGGAIRVGSSLQFEEGSTVVTTGAICYQDRNSDNQLRQRTDNWTSNSFRFRGNDVTFIAIPALLNDFEPIASRGALGFSSATPNIDFPIRGYTTNGSSDSDCRLWAGCRPILTNCALGSQLIAVPHISGNNTSYGVYRIMQEVQVTILDGAGSPVNEAIVYTRDTDNGNREIYNRESHVFDATEDRIYQQVTDATGNTPTYDIDIAYNIVNNGNGDGANTGNYAWDYRGNNNDDSDVFSFLVFSYLHNFTSFNAILKGVNEVDAGTTVFIDTSITNTDRTAVDGYTEINSSARFYDRAKSFLYDNYAGESELIVIKSGEVIDAGSFNVTIDPSAADAFDFDGTDITIRATEFSGSIVTTGLISLAGSASATGSLTDTNGTRTSIEFTNLAMMVLNLELVLTSHQEVQYQSLMFTLKT